MEVEQKKTNTQKIAGRVSPSVSAVVQVLVHLACLLLYAIPILTPNEHGGPVLDEMHIMSPDNLDIRGNSTLEEVFRNDYWGRPMQSESSHRSWRPLTVLSFRYLKGMFTSTELTVHRLLNTLTHAAAAEVVGILALRLFRPRSDQDALLLRMATKIVFALHPTHVEVTANAANRNHIMAVVFSTCMCDPQCSFLIFTLAALLGFLCSETFLFQVPAAMVTLVVLKYYERQENKSSKQTKGLVGAVLDYLSAAFSVYPRLLMMLLSIALYLGGRAYFDTLNIPEGLIRPAENPFYRFEGEHRARNYLYIFAVHIGKSWGLDPIGFSHEYGFDCIPELETWEDPRLVLPYAVVSLLVLSLVLAFSFPRTLLGPVAIHWGWLITLFPITGFVKVGTFVSDRIVVASTVSVCLWIGGGLYFWFTRLMSQLPAAPLQAILLGWLLATSAMRVQSRSLEWMDSISLVESSLETCPRFAKSHMEMSKIYSGLYAHRFDLAKAREHLEIAREIDPDMCDIHYQFAHVSIQEGKFLEFEEELTQAIMCPFSMGGALPMWQNYWNVAMSGATTDEAKMEVQERQQKYSRIIQEAAGKAQQEEEMKQETNKESPFVSWK